MKRTTELEYELMGVPNKLPVDIEFEYNRPIPGCGSSLPEREHVVVKAIHQRIGLHEKRDITFMLNGKKADIEEQILQEIRENREFGT